MVTIIPGIVYIDDLPLGIISVTKHRVPFNLNKHRSPGINFRLEGTEGKSLGVAIITIYILVEVCSDAIAARFNK
jgi:hypothetical protein